VGNFSHFGHLFCSLNKVPSEFGRALPPKHVFSLYFALCLSNMLGKHREFPRVGAFSHLGHSFAGSFLEFLPFGRGLPPKHVFFLYSCCVCQTRRVYSASLQLWQLFSGSNYEPLQFGRAIPPKDVFLLCWSNMRYTA
jgi:hypothetical protein